LKNLVFLKILINCSKIQSFKLKRARNHKSL
jgi:hypothetical protein